MSLRLTASRCRVIHSQTRGKGYRGEEEGIEPIYQLEVGSSVANWVTRPHNYARMQVFLLMWRLPSLAHLLNLVLHALAV